MKLRSGLSQPEHVLEMLYHRELGYGLNDGDDLSRTFQSAFKALNVEVSEEKLAAYRGYFIEHGFGKFDGKIDPGFRISPHGEELARSIVRRQPWHSLRRLRSYDWSFVGGVTAVIAAIFSLLALFRPVS